MVYQLRVCGLSSSAPTNLSTVQYVVERETTKRHNYRNHNHHNSKQYSLAMVDTTQYKVGLVLSIEECGSAKSNKPLKTCRINIGDESSPITVVTSAPNVREGNRYVLRKGRASL